MGVEYPPQRFCDKCDMPDYEYPYTSYTGQIDQVVKVIFGEEQYHHSWSGGYGAPPPMEIGIDLGDLCQKCRYETYEKIYELLPKYKDYPKKIDQYADKFHTNDNKKIKGWWDREIEIKSHTGKTLKDGRFI